MKTMSLDTIFTNSKTIEKFEVATAMNLEAAKTGKIALGVKGDRLVIVMDSTSFFTRIANFFRGISTNVTVVGKVFVATKLAHQRDPRLLELADKVGKLNPASKAAELTFKSAELTSKSAELDAKVTKLEDEIKNAKVYLIATIVISCFKELFA